MKDLVFVLPDKNGGVASVVYNLLQFSHKTCFTKVLLLQVEEADKNNNNIAYTFPCDEQVVIRYKESAPKYKVINCIAKYLNENSILISNEGNLELATLYFKKISIPVVYILHGNIDYYFQTLRRYEKIIDKVICVSSYLRQRIDQEKIDILSIFIPFSIPSIPEFCKSYNSSKINIVYVGTLGDHKGVKYFPEYIEQLDKLDINYTFDIVGNGKNEEYLKKQFSCNRNVIVHGLLTTEETFAFLRKAHILLLFSKGEGLPVCVVEAMKHGVVPIVFDIPSGVPDIIDSGKDGFIVPQGGISDAADITKTLFEDRALLQAIGQHGQEKACKMFDPVNQANEYINTIVSAPLNKKEYKIGIKTIVANYIPSRILYLINDIKIQLQHLLHLR